MTAPPGRANSSQACRRVAETAAETSWLLSAPAPRPRPRRLCGARTLADCGPAARTSPRPPAPALPGVGLGTRRASPACTPVLARRRPSSVPAGPSLSGRGTGERRDRRGEEGRDAGDKAACEHFYSTWVSCDAGDKAAGRRSASSLGPAGSSSATTRQSLLRRPGPGPTGPWGRRNRRGGASVPASHWRARTRPDARRGYSGRAARGPPLREPLPPRSAQTLTSRCCPAPAGSSRPHPRRQVRHAAPATPTHPPTHPPTGPAAARPPCPFTHGPFLPARPPTPPA